jgi:hypothetical protein
MICPRCASDLTLMVAIPTNHEELRERQATYECKGCGRWRVCRHEYRCPACLDWCVDPLFHHVRAK